MAFCWKCGTKINEGNQFCGNCGSDIHKATSLPTTPQSPPPDVPPDPIQYRNANDTKKSTGLKIPVLVLSIVLVLVLIASSIGYVTFNQKVTDLTSQKTQLTSDLNAAHNSITTLNNQLNTANGTISKLNDDLSIANTKASALTASLSAANSSITKLNSDIVTANNSITSLNSQNALLTANLSTANSTITGLNSNIATLNTSIASMNSNYQAIVSAINVRFAFTQAIAESFVTPGDSSVISRVHSLVTAFTTWNKAWQDFYTMYNWVYQNIYYSYDSPEPVLPSNLNTSAITWRSDYWRYPTETLGKMTGDCEDQALLLVSMIRAYEGTTYNTWVVEVTFNDGSAHMAVMMDIAGGGLVILDPAGGFYTHSTAGAIYTGKSAAAALNDWSSYWAAPPNSRTGLLVSDVFNEGFYKSFTSNSDFTNWITSLG